MTQARIKRLVRPNQMAILPSTVPFSNRPVEEKGPGFRLNAAWMDFFHELNPGEKEFRFITAPHTGVVNQEWTTYPLTESLSTGGNLLSVEVLDNGFAWIAGVNYFAPPPFGMNYFNAPSLIHKFDCVAPDGTPRKPSTALDVYYVVFTRGDLFVPVSKLDFTLTTPPPLPPGASSVPADVRIVFRRTVARQRPDPNSPKNYVYDAGARVVVSEVSGGWAHVERGWVLQSDLVPA